MIFEVNNDNRPYLEARGKIILNACPGSGKTSAIAYKLTNLISECEEKFGSYAGVVCLSFTNVAKDEITHKYEQIKGNRLDYPHMISTIDSFINQYITLPYYYLLSVPVKRPSILNTVDFLDTMNLGRFLNKQNKPLKFSYPPSKLKIEIDGTFSWKGNKPKNTIVEDDEFKHYAKTYKTWQIKNGYINNDDSTYLASYLLKKYPEIGRSLIQRFPYIIIDEAQDTSELQYEIFDLLISAGLSNIEFVGDPYQSLYEFREARPDLFIQRFNEIAKWQAFRLNNCRRSSQKIINIYSIFRSPKELPIVSICKHITDNKLQIIRYDESDLSGLINKYKKLVNDDSSNYILVRGTTHLQQFGIKVTSEEPWKNNIAKTLLDAQNHFTLGNIKAAIDNLRIFLAEITVAGDYKAKNIEVLKFREDINLNISFFDFLKNMPSIDDTLLNWTKIMTSYIKTKFGIEVDLELKKKGAPFYALNLKDILYPQIETPFPISTIHKVKGMTFSSILLVLSDNSSGEKFSLTDFIKPTDFPSEKQRMLYVALSRPEVHCCLAIPKKFSELQITEKLGTDIEFII